MPKPEKEGVSSPLRIRRPRQVILASSDSNNWFSSHTNHLVLRRNSDGTIVLKLEYSGMDAIPEEEWDAEGRFQLHYEADVDSAESLLDLLTEPDWRVAERVRLPEIGEILRRVATLDPHLSAEAQRLSEERSHCEREREGGE